MLRHLFALLCIAFLASCSKDKDKKPESSQYPYYFKGTINGKLVKFEANDEDTHYGNGTVSLHEGTGWDNVDYSEGTFFQNPLHMDRNYINVSILKHFNDDPTDAQRLAMFRTGSYGYGKSNRSPATVDGATIAYLDDQGVEWSSEGGDQTGSTFTITELTNSTNGHSMKIFKAQFNCKLYDAEGHSIQVTNAEVRGQILSN